MSKRANKQSRRFRYGDHPRPQRLAVYCIHCEMWFDSDKGWPVNRSGSGIPLCQHCGAPLMQMEYNEFMAANAGRLDEVITWEWPEGAIWTKGAENP